MALAPKFAGQRYLLSSTPSNAMHTVELYLDYVCPFSAKMFKTLYTTVLPSARTKSYAGNVQFIFRQQIQPWHPSSTLVHEAGVAVLRLAPGRFWDFSERLFAAQADYFDESVVRESRNDTYKRLAKLGASVGVAEEEMFGLLKVADGLGEGGVKNGGNKVTDDLKQLVKAARLTGVHVTPTVLFNGLVENSISSSFSADEWHEWLEKNCKVPQSAL